MRAISVVDILLVNSNTEASKLAVMARFSVSDLSDVREGD